MKKILHFIGEATVGGVGSVVINYYKHMDHSLIHFDVVAAEGKVGRDAHILESLGCKIYTVPLKSKDLIGFIRGTVNILKNSDYDAIHVCAGTSFITLLIAKYLGVKCRIAHSHSAGNLQKYFLSKVRYSICKILNRYYATHLMACGIKAGQYGFGERAIQSGKIKILPNAINTEQFSFNATIRKRRRLELNIDNRFVIGMIGRIAPPKNTIYAMTLFKAIKEKIPSALLLMAGDGVDMERTQSEAKRLDIFNDVFFLGRCDDVAELAQAFDLYILPSLFEGFPVAAVEAMATGLPCLLSDTITDELNFGTAVHYLPLDRPDLWAEKAMLYVDDIDRASRVHEVKDNGLDIRDTSKLLEEFYLSI